MNRDTESGALSEARRAYSEDACPANKFELAHFLVLSNVPLEIDHGLCHLRDLVERDPQFAPLYLYHMALGHYRLKEFNVARKELDTALSLPLTPSRPPSPSPDSDTRCARSKGLRIKAEQLRAQCEEELKRDGLLGLGMVAGAVAAGAGLMFLLGKSLRNKK